MENIKPVKMKWEINPRRIGFLLKDKPAVVPMGQTMNKNTSFELGKTLPNGNVTVTPTEGPLRGKTCILSDTTEIILDVGLA